MNIIGNLLFEICYNSLEIQNEWSCVFLFHFHLMKEHDVFFFFCFLGDVFELVKSIFHLAETDVSIEEIIAPCDQPWL
jgi:hypothetical protein